jgi:hypothetical protein
MLNIIRPEHKISIKEINNAIFITDEKVVHVQNNYKLANERLSESQEFVEDFVDTCLNLGFTYALQDNHPRKSRRGDAGDGLQYISFGREYDSGTGASWDVGIDKDSPKTVCIEKRHKNVLHQAKIPFEKESGDTHNNLRINPEQLKPALTAILSGAFKDDDDANI